MTKTLRKRQNGKTCGGGLLSGLFNICSEKININYKNAYLKDPDFNCQTGFDNGKLVFTSDSARIICDKHFFKREYNLWKEGFEKKIRNEENKIDSDALKEYFDNAVGSPINILATGVSLLPYKIGKKVNSALERRAIAYKQSKNEMSSDPYVSPREISPLEGYSVISYSLIVRDLYFKSKGFDYIYMEQQRRGLELIKFIDDNWDEIKKNYTQFNTKDYDKKIDELKKRLIEEYGNKYDYNYIKNKLQNLKKKGYDNVYKKESKMFNDSLNFINGYADDFNKRNFYVYCDDKGTTKGKEKKLYRLYATKLVNESTGKKQPVIMFWIDGITPSLDCIPIYEVPTPILVNFRPPSTGGKSKKKQLPFKKNGSRKFRQTRRNIHP
jgi:hypothetical protein